MSSSVFEITSDWYLAGRPMREPPQCTYTLVCGAAAHCQVVDASTNTARGELDLTQAPFKEIQVLVALPGEKAIALQNCDTEFGRTTLPVGSAYLSIPDLKEGREHAVHADVCKYLATSAVQDCMGLPESAMHITLRVRPSRLHTSTHINNAISIKESRDAFEHDSRCAIAALAHPVYGVLAQLNAITAAQPQGVGAPGAPVLTREKEAMAKATTSTIMGGMLLPDPTNFAKGAKCPIDASMLHEILTQHGAVAAGSQSVQYEALRILGVAWNMEHRDPATPAHEHLANAFRQEAPLMYTFDAQWVVDAEGHVRVGKGHGENFSFSGMQLSSAPMDERLTASMQRALKGMQEARTLEEQQQHIAAHNDAARAVNKPFDDCENAANFSTIVHAVLCAHAKLSEKKFVQTYRPFAKMYTQPESEFVDALRDMHKFLRRATRTGYMCSTALVLAGGAKLDAGVQGQATSAPASRQMPRDLLVETQRSAQTGALAGHAVNFEGNMFERFLGNIQVKVDGKLFTYEVHALDEQPAMREGTAWAQPVSGEAAPGDADLTAMTAEAVPGGAYTSGIPAQVAAVTKPCSRLDAGNRIAALAAKQIEASYAPLNLTVSASVGYSAYEGDNFYKVLLSMGPGMIFSVEDTRRLAQPRPVPSIALAEVFGPEPARAGAGAPVGDDVVLVVCRDGAPPELVQRMQRMQRMLDGIHISPGVRRLDLATPRPKTAPGAAPASAPASALALQAPRPRAITLRRVIDAQTRQHVANIAQHSRGLFDARPLGLRFDERVRCGLLRPPLRRQRAQHAAGSFANSVRIDGAITCSPLCLSKAMSQRTPDYAAAEAALERERNAHAILREQFRAKHTDAENIEPASASPGLGSLFTMPPVSKLTLSHAVFDNAAAE